MTETAQVLTEASSPGALEGFIAFLMAGGAAIIYRAWRLRGALGVVVQGVAWFRRFAIAQLDLSGLGLTEVQQQAVRARVGSWAFSLLERLIKGAAEDAKVESVLQPIVKRETTSMLKVVDEHGNPVAPPPGAQSGRVRLFLLAALLALLALGLAASTGCAGAPAAYVEADAERFKTLDPILAEMAKRAAAEDAARLERTRATWRKQIVDAGGELPPTIPLPARYLQLFATAPATAEPR